MVFEAAPENRLRLINLPGLPEKVTELEEEARAGVVPEAGAKFVYALVHI